MCHEKWETNIYMYHEIELDLSTGTAGAVLKSKQSDHTTSHGNLNTTVTVNVCGSALS